MKIVDIDNYSLTGNTILHKISASKKLLWAFGLILLIVITNNYQILLPVYIIMFLYIIFSTINKKMILILTYYPLLFIVLVLLSTHNLTFEFILLLSLKVLIASTTMVLLFATTTYIEVFSKLHKFLPSFILTTFFLTYRAIYILWTTLENIQQAIYLRGGISYKKPIRSLKVISHALGFLVIKSIDTSEKMYESMMLRGYSGKFKYIEEK